MMRLVWQRFQNALKQQQGFKVISGIANFDQASVLMLARAAKSACAEQDGLALDVAARPEIIRAVRAEFNGMLFASSVDVAELIQAVEAGADGAELGNFDALYAQGVYISAEDVLLKAQAMVDALSGGALLSVTVPGHLGREAQIQLAAALEAMGVDVIQTEGAARLLSQPPQVKALRADEKAALTFENTRLLSQAVSIPVMAASGLSAENMAQARLAGASAVGIGSAVNKLVSQHEMEVALIAISQAWLQVETTATTLDRAVSIG